MSDLMLPDDFKLLKKGSTKDIYVREGDADHLYFTFSDRYSVFDFGEMPDHLSGKGQVLGSLARFFFEKFQNPASWQLLRQRHPEMHGPLLTKLSASGLETHYVETVSLARASSPLLLKMKRYLVPNCDCQSLKERPENTVVPLEIIFRFSLVEGSSLLKRQFDPQVRLDLNLPPLGESRQGELRAGHEFHVPVIEFTTKLEKKDRPLSYAQAQELAGLTNEEFKELRQRVSLIALLARDLCQDSGIELIDGKVEFAFGERQKGGQRQLVLMDSLGPDEMRLIYGETDLSKEFLRQHYRQTAWYGEWSKGDRENRPEPLPLSVKERAEENYQLLLNRLCPDGKLASDVTFR